LQIKYNTDTHQEGMDKLLYNLPDTFCEGIEEYML